jgi:hypothetical protein
MVKASDKQGYVAFSFSGCGSWVDIPTSMIETAERAGTRACSDHSHPVMRINLKAPSSAEGQILQALLSQSAAGPSPYGATGLTFPGGAPGGVMPLANDGRWLKCFGGTTACGPDGKSRCNYECCRNSPYDPFFCRITGPALIASDNWVIAPF